MAQKIHQSRPSKCFSIWNLSREPCHRPRLEQNVAKNLIYPPAINSDNGKSSVNRGFLLGKSSTFQESNMAGWKIDHLWVMFLLKPPFSSGIFQPCLMTPGRVCGDLPARLSLRHAWPSPSAVPGTPAKGNEYPLVN